MPKVLLAEDDANLREIFEMRLRAEGFEVISAGDGEEALVMATKEKPDLAVIDIMMPKISGFEMLETLRSNPETSGIKAIMMTALGQAEDRERGEALGVLKYLVKSQVTLEDFVRSVREILGPSKQNNEKGSTMDDPQTAPMNDNQGMPPAEPAQPAAPAEPAAPAPEPVAPALPADEPTTQEEKTEVEAQINNFAAPAPAPEPAAPVQPSMPAPVDPGQQAAPAPEPAAPVQPGMTPGDTVAPDGSEEPQQ